jgi:predicted ATPase/DNA-binding SARP family transcriptional activator
MAHLSLAFLGAFRVTLGGEPVSGLQSHRLQALLAYLAVEVERVHRRQALAEMTWPDRPEGEALEALRYALSNLRAAIGDRETLSPFLLISRNTLQFNADSDYDLDVAAFQSYIAAAEALPKHSLPVDTLQSAVGLYRGDFLEGFFLSDAAPFEEWVLFKRELLARQMAFALRHLATIHERRGEYVAARACARRQLQMAPWDEMAHRQLMRALALSGQRSQALAQYKVCRQQLREELGVEPEQATRALYEAIRDGRLRDYAGRRMGPTAGPRSFVTSTPPTPTAPFVLREDELARLNRLLDRARAGQGQVVFVTGEAGSGKTALWRAFARQAMESDAELAVTVGQSSVQAGVGDPYLPFREILQTLTGDVEPQRAGGTITAKHARCLWAVFPEAVQSLLAHGPDLIDRFVPGEALLDHARAFAPPGSSWLPQLKALVEAGGTEPELTGEPQVALFEQVTQMLCHLARRYPLVLVLDDLHWADQGSLSLLFHLAQRLSGSRILLIGTYRPGDVALGRAGERHPLEPIVNELQRDFGEAWIDLDRTPGRAFVDAYLDVEPNRLDELFREALARHTGGNPLFTVEMMRALRERGDLVRDEAGRWIAGLDLNWELLPARVEAVIAEHVGRLSHELQRILDAASVVGETFTAEVVARALKFDENRLIRRLSGPLSKRHRLVGAQSLRRVGTQRLSSYRFRHHLFQKYLYHRLDEVQRARLHEAIGNALEALYADHESEVETVSPRLAHHFEAAGLADKAVAYLLQAGRRAVRLSAHREAIEHFTRGLELLETLPKSPERDQKELALQLALGVPLQAIKSYSTPERGRAYARAFELCLQVGEMEQLFQTLFMRWSFEVPQGRHRQGLELSEHLLTLAQQTQNSDHLVMAHTASGMSKVYLGEFAQARNHLEQVLAAYDPQRHDALIIPTGQNLKITGLSYLSWALWILGYPDQALQRADEAIALARELDHPFSSGFALGIAGCVTHLRCGKYETALKEAEELLQLWEELGFSLYRAWHLCVKGRVQAEIGPVEEGLASLREGVAACESLGIVASHTQQLYNLAVAYRNAELADEGLDVVAQALTLAEETGERHFEAELLRYRGELLLMQSGGDGAEAEDWLRQAIDLARRQGARSWELRAMMSLCRLWRHTGEEKAARQALAEIYDWFGEGFDTRDLREARALLESLGS